MYDSRDTAGTTPAGRPNRDAKAFHDPPRRSCPSSSSNNDEEARVTQPTRSMEPSLALDPTHHGELAPPPIVTD
jgi:hypothetical protein